MLAVPRVPTQDWLVDVSHVPLPSLQDDAYCFFYRLTGERRCQAQR